MGKNKKELSREMLSLVQELEEELSYELTHEERGKLETYCSYTEKQRTQKVLGVQVAASTFYICDFAMMAYACDLVPADFVGNGFLQLNTAEKVFSRNGIKHFATGQLNTAMLWTSSQGNLDSVLAEPLVVSSATASCG